MRDAEQFADFVSERSPVLTRVAWLLTGDWHLALRTTAQARQVDVPEEG